MDQVKKLLASLTLKQQISLVVAAVAVGAALWSLSQWSQERDFRPLYTSLAPEDAGQVVEQLRAKDVAYRLSDNGTTILVHSSQVAEMRLEMAAGGLPRSGRLGFELFDQTNFGATDFAEQVNYHRALEGELERSVVALAEVDRARVHVTFPKKSVFLSSSRPAKASVMVRLRGGARLSPQNVKAICYMVSSAVEGLEADAVTVLDMHGNLLNRPRNGNGLDNEEPSEALLVYRRAIERDLLAKIESTLEPLLGPAGFRAGVTVDCDFSSGEESEELFDPDRSVMTVSQRTEDVSGTKKAAGGVPGTASNLPRSESRLARTSPGRARRTENLAFQTSRTVRHTRLPQGEVKRISVALLVDHEVQWQGQGADAQRVVTPLGAEKLQVIRDLVTGAIGLQPDRGDQLVVESLPFESTRNWQAPAVEPPTPAGEAIPLPDWLKPYIKDERTLLIVAGAAAGALLLMVAGGLVFLRKRRKSKVSSVTTQKAIAAAEGDELPAIEEGPGVASKMKERLVEQASLKARLEEEALRSLKLPSVKTKKTEVLTKHISEEAQKDPAAMAQLVRTWLNEEGD